MIKKVIKIFRPILMFGMRSWWYITRPKTAGAKVVIIFENKILLIKTTYEYSYSLPGGGIKKNETPEAAAKREVFEEVGILLNEVTALPSFVTHEEYKEDTVYSFYSEVTNKNYKLDSFEIDKAEWHPLDDLPKLGQITSKIINLYKNK
jgi:8-oxo-dGTP pyrophosphatase MutT (NUDIX family)